MRVVRKTDRTESNQCMWRSVKRNHPERDLQIAVAQLLNALPSIGYLGWFHPANGGSRDKREARIFAALGVKPGVPDIIIVRPSKRSAMRAFIELKSDKGRLTPAQQAWHEELRLQGWNGAVCRSLDEVIAALKQWGYMR